MYPIKPTTKKIQMTSSDIQRIPSNSLFGFDSADRGHNYYNGIGMSAGDINSLKDAIKKINNGNNGHLDDFNDNMPPPFLGLDKSASASQFLAGPGQGGLNLNKNNSFLGGGFMNSAFSLNRESSAFKLNVKEEKSANSPEIHKNGVNAVSERNYPKRR